MGEQKEPNEAPREDMRLNKLIVDYVNRVYGRPPIISEDFYLSMLGIVGAFAASHASALLSAPETPAAPAKAWVEVSGTSVVLKVCNEWGSVDEGLFRWKMLKEEEAMLKARTWAEALGGLEVRNG